MINVSDFYDFLEKEGISFFAGVPDSQLKPFCDHITAKLGAGRQHIIAANEGNAVALAAGYHISTGKIGMVYMQNSGLGNAVNPITSLTDPEVYAIPILYMVGWRGEPGVKDEPQHVKQGKITEQLLRLLGIFHVTLSEKTTMAEIKEKYAKEILPLLRDGKSAAFLVEKNAFEGQSAFDYSNQNQLSRERAIQIILDEQPADAINVSTTGKASRELFEYREKLGQGHERDFLTVGSMGHASMIALSIAEHTTGPVWCLDGDGALIMHLGASALIGSRKPKNLVHILLNNGAHESVGGMPTIAAGMDWMTIAGTLGYRYVCQARTEEEVRLAVRSMKQAEGPVFLEILTEVSSRSDLTRPTVKPVDNKKNMMKYIMKAGEADQNEV